MLEYSKKIFWGAIVLAVILQCKFSHAADSYEVDVESAPIDASQLKATRFTSALDADISTGENLIYCPALQESCSKSIDSSSIFLRGSFNKNLSCNYKFDNCDEPLIFSKEPNMSVPVEAFGIEYKKSLKKEESEGKKTLGLEFGGLIGQTKLLYYYFKPDDTPYYDSILDRNKPENFLFLPRGFVIKIITADDSDELIISTIPVEKTLEKTYDFVNHLISKDFFLYLKEDSMSAEVKNIKSIIVNKIKEQTDEEGGPDFTSSKKFMHDLEDKVKPFNSSIEKIKIPKININIYNIKSDLEERNSKNIIRKIDTPARNLKLKINATGKKYSNPESFNNPIIVFGAGISRFPFKTFCIANGPFIIFLRKNSSNFPYFMAYIANEELLVKAKNNPSGK